jgi:hypothetical protein
LFVPYGSRRGSHPYAPQALLVVFKSIRGSRLATAASCVVGIGDGSPSEVLGLTWELVNLDTGELYVSEQVQRVGHRLIRRQIKTESSEAPLPLPDLCVAALKLRRQLDSDS